MRIRILSGCKTVILPSDHDESSVYILKGEGELCIEGRSTTVGCNTPSTALSKGGEVILEMGNGVRL